MKGGEQVVSSVWYAKVFIYPWLRSGRCDEGACIREIECVQSLQVCLRIVPVLFEGGGHL